MTLQDLMRITRGFERISGEYFASVIRASGYTDDKGIGGMRGQFKKNPCKFIQDHLGDAYSKKLFMTAWQLGEEP